jgi:hypothetical protein
VRAIAHVFRDQALFISNDHVLAIHKLLVICVNFDFFYLLLFPLFVFGVDNVLVKGEIVNMWLYVHVVFKCDK